jgi:hypothetical protein
VPCSLKRIDGFFGVIELGLATILFSLWIGLGCALFFTSSVWAFFSPFFFICYFLLLRWPLFSLWLALTFLFNWALFWARLVLVFHLLNLSLFSSFFSFFSLVGLSFSLWLGFFYSFFLLSWAFFPPRLGLLFFFSLFLGWVIFFFLLSFFCCSRIFLARLDLLFLSHHVVQLWTW